MNTCLEIVLASAAMFHEAALYVLLGFLVAGLLRTYVQPATVLTYLRGGRFRSVMYASLLGVPIPL